MYEAFYGLTERPFNLTPDPRFLYLSKKHEEALAHLLYGIRNRTGFILVSGEVGAGKTTVCRSLIGRLDPGTELALVFNPWLSAVELLKKINEEFGIRSEAETIKGLIDELNHYLLDCFHQDKNCVLIIDEAQDLEPATLEQIRLLSNLETDTQKLLQIVLLGQPEIVESLARDDLRQLNQRITARYHLGALDYDEMVEYIASRLRVAGGRRKLTFAPASLKAIYRASGGIPRMVNAVCDRALLIGYTQETREITIDIVQQAEREIRGEPIRKRRNRDARERPAWVGKAVGYVGKALAAGLLIALAVGVAGFGLEGLGRLTQWVGAMTAASPGDGAADLPETDQSLPPEALEDVVVAAPSVQPPSPLAAFVDGHGPETLRNAGAVALLRAWNAPMTTGYPNEGGAEELAAFFDANRLDAQVVTAPFSKVAALDLPVFVKLLGQQAVAWTAVEGRIGEEMTLVGGLEERTSFAAAELEKRYLGQAVVIGRDPSPGAPALKQGSRGDRVRRVQQKLFDLGYMAMPPDGIFDRRTEKAVRALQADLGLEVDGIVGRQTRMPLLARLPGEAQQAGQEGQPAAAEAAPPLERTKPAQESAATPAESPSAEATPSELAEQSPSTAKESTAPETVTDVPSPGHQDTAQETAPPSAGVNTLEPAPAEEAELAEPALAGAPLVPRAPGERAPADREAPKDGEESNPNAEESP